MNLWIRMGCLALLLLLSGCESGVEPEGSTSADPVLAKLFSEWDEAYLRLHPFRATARGDHRYDDRWGPDPLSQEYLDQYLALNEDFLHRLLAIDFRRLNAQDRLSFDLFLYQRQRWLDSHRQGHIAFANLMPINQFSNMPNYLSLLGSGENAQPFDTVQDYEEWIARSSGFVEHVELLIAQMRKGVRQGVVQPRILMQRLLPQLAAQQVENVRQSPFWKPVSDMPETFSEADRDKIRTSYERHIRQVLLPAYARLRQYIEQEYLPHTRDSIGLADLPGGRAYYDYRVEESTTTRLTAEAIHELGKAQVRQLFAAMQRVREQVGFQGDMPAFFAYLRSDPRFQAETPEELLQIYGALRQRINAALPEIFNIQPRSDYVLKEVEAFRAASMAAAQYYPAAADGSRPGIFYVNTYNLASRPLYMVQALSLHEASPGHHFQISIAQEQQALPAFRRFAGFTAYVEGWALYAESLGKELGLYQDPYQYFGSLVTEIWRANRLVVDTGIHALGWTRQQAIDWMLAYSPLLEEDVKAEVDRYIAIPGQALSYKVGQLKIREMREKAEIALGDRFDLRAFHDRILTTGAIPLSLLEQVIDRWLAGGGAGSRTSAGS